MDVALAQLCMLNVLYSVGHLGWELVLNHRRATRLLAELETVVAPYGFEITPRTRDRIRLYTALIAITSHWYGLLRGTPPNREEIDDALRLGAFTPLADDLMDEHGWSFEELIAQANNSSSEHVLLTYFMERITALRQSRPAFDRYFVAAHKAQNASLKQLQKEPLPLEYLQHITYEKGGQYALLYRSVLQHPFVEGEEEFVYHSVGGQQILNDLFDLHKDYHNGSQTLINRNPDVRAAERLLDALADTLRDQIRGLNYPARNKARAFRSIMSINVRGYVALDQFRDIQGDRPTIDIGAHTQAELLVDMEKPINVWKNVYYTWRETKGYDVSL